VRFGCGVDVVEIKRLRAAVRRGGAAFLRRVFTERELAYAKARRRTTFEHLAGRFAAKEAVIKALSQVEPADVPSMRQIEICNDRMGRPSVRLHEARRRRLSIHISLSHVDSVAVASAIVTV
jgi:holo-[acyl-carrier protein] synthase